MYTFDIVKKSDIEKTFRVAKIKRLVYDEIWCK